MRWVNSRGQHLSLEPAELRAELGALRKALGATQRQLDAVQVSAAADPLPSAARTLRLGPSGPLPLRPEPARCGR